MHYLKKDEMYKINALFEGWEETLIWSCQQGYMGSAWIDSVEEPKSAQIVIGDFSFFGGVPNEDLVKNIPAYFRSECLIMIPQNNAWSELIEKEHRGNCQKTMRYAIKKEPDIFDTKKLKAYIDNIPDEFVIREIDEELFNRLPIEQWSKDFISQFPTYKDFEKHGIGYVACDNEKPVSGAASYTVYNNGIEIEIDTKKEYRRKGLAIACASKLIVECLNRGIYPSWDAANKDSLALSEKLGYHFDKEYEAYEVSTVPVKDEVQKVEI